MATGIVNPYALAADFSPEMFPFVHLYWAGGPNMLAQGYANNDDVPVWPCEITGNSVDDLVPESGYSANIFDYKTAGVNGQPSVYFAAANQAHEGLRLAARWSDYSALKAEGLIQGTARGYIGVEQKTSGSNTNGSYVINNADTSSRAATTPWMKTTSNGTTVSVKIDASDTVGATSTDTSTALVPNVYVMDMENSGTLGAAYTDTFMWHDGAAVATPAGETISTHREFGYWGIGSNGQSASQSIKKTHIAFVGVYQHPSILMRNQPMFGQLNDWFLDTYGEELIT